jgi:dipeptidyl aminopeptidase/acylaminoacyl peptidase
MKPASPLFRAGGITIAVGEHLALVLVLCAGSGLARGSEPIPASALFSNPRVSSPRLSPDGTRIACLYSKGDEQGVFVRDTKGGPVRFLVGITDLDTRFAWLDWANDERILISAQARAPLAMGVSPRVTRLFVVDHTGKGYKWLGRRWPLQAQFQDRIVHLLPDEPERVLIQYRDPGERYPCVRKMSIRSGKLKRHQRVIPGVNQWHADRDGRVRVGEGALGNRYRLWARTSVDQPFKDLCSHHAFQEDGLRFAGFAEDPKKIYVRGPHEGRGAIFSFDLQKAQVARLVFAHPEVDAGGLVYDWDTGRRLVAVRYVVDEPQVHFIDKEAERELAAIENALSKDLGRRVHLRTVSRRGDRQVLILEASSELQPPVYYSYDRATRNLGFLLSSRPDVDVEALSSTQRLTYEARDGLAIPAYLTVPKGVAPQKLPVIVMPHGGPWARDAIRWNPEVQLMASCGFAVFRMNFRGSSGYGSAFERAGYREWGQAIQDDITDGVRWLIEQGIADPNRIGIYGTSYGGYAAMMGIVRTPDLYRAGASYAGVMDIETLVEDDGRYLWSVDWHDVMVGKGRDDRERLRSHSPLRRAAEIRVPVLLAHGENDARVHVHHSRRMAEALEDEGASVEYLEFPKETHGFILEKNRIRFYEELARFFGKHLAPRVAATNPAAGP